VAISFPSSCLASFYYTILPNSQFFEKTFPFLKFYFSLYLKRAQNRRLVALAIQINLDIHSVGNEILQWFSGNIEENRNDS